MYYIYAQFKTRFEENIGLSFGDEEGDCHAQVSKITKAREKINTRPSKKKMDDNKNLANFTKSKKEVGVQMQELTKNCKDKEALIKHQNVIQL